MSDLAIRIERLQQGVAAELKPAEALSLAREIQAGGEAAGLRPLRVAVLASFSFQFAEPHLVVEGARRGLLLQVHFGPFGHFEEALAESGAVAAFDPEVLVLAMRPEDIDPDAVVRFHASHGARFTDLVDGLIGRLADCVRRVRTRSSAPVLIANFAPPASLPLGVFDANVPEGLGHRLAATNARLARELAALPDATVWDYAGLVRERGAGGWTDRRLLALARAPVAASHQSALARHLTRTLRALLRPPAKCLVLDLDNTLWGGVVGDDGLEGLALGDDHPGVAYKSFQRAALALRDRGILLAVASKNDPDTAERVFREHPEMLIRWEDLAATRIHWGPKSQSLREIAGDLNLGADALVLFDDNPVERAEVRANAPEVRVVEVPTDPLHFEWALAECGEFDSVTLTAEDSARAELYRQERDRRGLEQRSASFEEFLHGLGMQARAGRVGPATMGRVGQLLARTNQFNLTTRRHGRAEIEAMGADPEHAVTWLRLRDRYGDAGLVAVGVLRREGELAVIDSFLMSCRVMGRGVERALLCQLADDARALGCRRLIGEYLPTRRNRVVEDFYPQHGFAADGELPDGGRRYAIDLADASLAWPEAIGRDRAADPAEP